MAGTPARLVSLRAAVAACLVAAVPLSGTLPASGATLAFSDYEQSVNITFPVRGRTSYGDWYWAARSGGRVHQSTDIMAKKMQRVYAVKNGTICWITGVTEKAPSYGMMISLCASDGRTYNYLHLNNDTPGTDDGKSLLRYAYAPKVRLGVTVKRGQLLGWVGDSGNAETTAPHLHFEIREPRLRDPRLGKPGLDPTKMDPYRSLRRAEARGDYPGARYPQP